MERFLRIFLVPLSLIIFVNSARAMDEDVSWSYVTTGGDIYVRIWLQPGGKSYGLSQGDVTMISPQCDYPQFRVCLWSDLMDLALPRNSVSVGDAWEFGRSTFAVVSGGFDLKIAGRPISDIYIIRVSFDPAIKGYQYKHFPDKREFRLVYSNSDGLFSIVQIKNGFPEFEALSSGEAFFAASGAD